MAEPLVSVIVPVYNMELYLEECIESVLSQSYGHVELVLIDDGSNDRSLEICRKYENLNNVKLVAECHHGQSFARKRGVLEASGEWIVFLDSDDMLLKNAITDLLEESADEVDIVLGVTNDDTYFVNFVPSCLNLDEYLKGMAYKKFNTCPWGKMFRRSIFNDKSFNFPESIRMGEDTLMNLQVAVDNNRSVRVCTKKVCFHRSNPQSICHTFKPSLDYYYSYCVIFDDILCKGNRLSEKVIAKCKHQLRRSYVYRILKKEGISEVFLSHPLVLDYIHCLQNVSGHHFLEKLFLKTKSTFVVELIWLGLRIQRRFFHPSMLHED